MARAGLGTGAAESCWRGGGRALRRVCSEVRVPALSLRRGSSHGCVPWGMSLIWRTWEPGLQECHHFSLERGDRAPRESWALGPQSLSVIPSLSIQTCSPAQTHFPRSPVVPSHSRTAKGTVWVQPHLHPSLAASFAPKPARVAFPARLLMLDAHPVLVVVFL